eukprot:gene11737-13861_t
MGDNERKTERLSLHLNSDLTKECMFVPAPMTISEVEKKRVYEMFDLVDKGYITKQDFLRLAGDPVVVDELYESHFPDVKDHGRVTQKDFTSLLNGLALRRPPLNWKERIYLTFSDPSSSKVSQYISLFIMVLILLSSVSFVMETLPEYSNPPTDDPKGQPVPDPSFGWIETFCIVCFTIEFMSRFLFVHAMRDESLLVLIFFESSEQVLKGENTDGMRKTVYWLLDTMNLIDAAAIAPFYVEAVLGTGSGGLGFLRVVRLARVFRVFKMGKYNEGMQLFGRVMIMSSPALSLLLFFSLISMVVFGSMVYFAEAGEWTVNDQYPDGEYLRPDITHTDEEPTPFKSIPDSFWWVIVTSSTVGYGDFYPTTAFGKLVATLCMVSGVLVLALPITIIGSNFANEYCLQEERKKEELAKQVKRLRRTTAWDEGRYDELLSEGVICFQDIPEKEGAESEFGMMLTPGKSADPESAYPESAYSESAYPELDYPESAYPESAYPESAYPQSAYPQSAYPKAAYPGTNGEAMVEEQDPMAVAAAAALADAASSGTQLIQSATESKTLPGEVKDQLVNEVSMMNRVLQEEGWAEWNGQAELLVISALSSVFRTLMRDAVTAEDQKKYRKDFMIYISKVTQVDPTDCAGEPVPKPKHSAKKTLAPRKKSYIHVGRGVMIEKKKKAPTDDSDDYTNDHTNAGGTHHRSALHTDSIDIAA